MSNTRPCMATTHIRIERTDEELSNMYENSKYKDNMSKHDFFKLHRSYSEKRTVNARWHMFAQETEEDSNGNIQYPVAIVELEDGTVKTVSAEDVKFIKEEDNE